MSACFGRCLLPKVVKIAGLWVMLYSGEKATGHASGASGGSTPIVLPRWRLPPCHGGAEGRLRRPRRAGTMDKDSLSHTSRYCACHAARVPRRRGRVPCGGTEREVGEIPGMLAGQAGGAGMAEGGRLPRPHAYLPPDRAQARRGRRGGQAGGAGARPRRASGTRGGGLASGDWTTWARGYRAGTVGPGEPAAGRHVRRQSDGSRIE